MCLHASTTASPQPMPCPIAHPGYHTAGTSRSITASYGGGGCSWVPALGCPCTRTPIPSLPLSLAPCWELPGLWLMSGLCARQAPPRRDLAKVQAQACVPALRGSHRGRSGCINRDGALRHSSTAPQDRSGGSAGEWLGQWCLHCLQWGCHHGAPFIPALCPCRPPQHSGCLPRWPPSSWCSWWCQVRQYAGLGCWDAVLPWGTDGMRCPMGMGLCQR